MPKILVVDDEPDIRALLRIVLERASFVVSEAGDGAEALAHCKQDIPDVILTDLLMPNMNGIELLEAVAGLGIDCKFVVMSGGNLGSDPTSEIDKISKMGVFGVVHKPFDPIEVLNACVRAAANEPDTQ